ncbi:MAG: response regulator [Deltaproteobacteria bacterium]|nr:response regulator [Candidatus Zymogenaceae bacterium]
MNETPKKPNFGSFISGTLIDLLEAFSDSGLSGTLLISSKLGIGTITIHRGEVIFAFSFESSRRYAHEMVKADRLPEGLVEPFIALIRKGPYTDNEADVLIESGMSQKKLEQAVDMINLSTLTSINKWEGVYRFYEEDFNAPPVHKVVDKKRLRTALTESGKTEPDIVDITLNDIISRELYDITQNDQSPMDILSSSARQVSLRLSHLKPKDVVILVGPNDEFRNSVAGNLADFGLFVEDFKTPADAFEHITGRQSEDIPVILVTDIGSPENPADSKGGDGFQLLRNVKEYYPHIPVIITGGMIDPNIRLKALFWGASGFIHTQGSEPILETPSPQEITLFTEELLYVIWNIIKTREILIEREHMSSLEQEMIDTIIEDFDDMLDKQGTRAPLKILVADDENEIRSAIRQYLTMDGYKNIDEASNGREAVDLFTEKKHDLIILDLVMPEITGIQVLRHVRSISSRTQVIIITGNADKNSAIMAVKLGAFDFIEKPFDFRELSSSVSKALEKNTMLRRSL